MSKISTKRTAEILFCKELLTQKEIALKVGVTEKTISTWARDGNWKIKRTEEINKSSNRVERVKELVNQITEKHIAIMAEITLAEQNGDNEKVIELRKESNKLSQEVAMQSKLLVQIDKESKISLSVYISVMDEIFKALKDYNMKIYLNTIDFQNEHLDFISLKY